jgi:hypothetical protein
MEIISEGACGCWLSVSVLEKSTADATALANTDTNNEY